MLNNGRISDNAAEQLGGDDKQDEAASPFDPKRQNIMHQPPAERTRPDPAASPNETKTSAPPPSTTTIPPSPSPTPLFFFFARRYDNLFSWLFVVVWML